jgi:hypothetical protein
LTRADRRLVEQVLLAGQPVVLEQISRVLIPRAYIILDVGGTSATESGNTLTLTLKLTFKPRFSGVKVMNLFVADNEELVSGLQTLGMWTVP